MQTVNLPLGKNKFALIDEEDWWKVGQYSWHVSSNGYVMCRAKTIIKYGSLLHRFIMNQTNPIVYVDHENRNKLDCRKENLRFLTCQQNLWNRETKGYSITPSGRYRVQFTIEGIITHIGTYETEDEAKSVVNTIRLETRRGYYNPNLPTLPELPA